jgi:metal-responsive CopG/Arc/MetJ family transcriptional regulator
MMGKGKIAITLDEEFVGELDRLVNEHVFQNRSQAIQEAVSEKLLRMKHSRLTMECSKLDPAFEKALAEEALAEDVNQWPQY